MKQKHTKYTQINTNKSMHSEIVPVWQKPIQRTVTTAQLIIIIIIIIRQFIRRRNMFVKSLQGRGTTYAARIKLMKLKVQNTTVKTKTN